ncbi:MAG: DUF3352 domain-containing protein [Planctomycetes bacterium]|nr:DUF3352 domain-containing protein [Planctomycetota bacterium]
MKRMWLAITLIVCGLVQTIPGGQTAWAEDGPSGAKLLPKDTLAFFSVPSVPDSWEAFDKSLSGALFRDPEMKPFLADVQKKIDELSEKLHEEIGVTIQELCDIPEGEMTFAVLERPVQKLAPVLLVDYGDNKETIEKLLKKMHEGLEGDIAEHSTQEIDDVKVHVYTLKDSGGDNPFKTLAYFNEDSYLVFSTEVDALKEVLDRMDGDSDDTLADNDVYKYIQERCKEESSEPAAVWFISPIGIIQAGLNMAQASVPQAAFAGAFLPILGFDKLKGFGGAGYEAAGDFNMVSKTFLYVDQPANGVLNAFQYPAAELAPPKWVPADASTYFGGNWNLAQAYLAIEGLVDNFSGRGTTARFLDDLSDKGPGLHPKKDVLDLLDGKFHVVQRSDAEESDEPKPQRILMAFDVKDAAKMKKTLAKAAKSDGSQMETREFNGETIYEVSAGPEPVSFVVASGHLVVTNDTATLEAMLRSERQPSLVESAAYRKIAKHFPAKMSMVSYSNSDAQMKSVYDLLKNADNVDFLDGIDFKKLPPFEVLQKYLRPSGFYMIPDKKGALSVSFQLSEGDK